MLNKNGIYITDAKNIDGKKLPFMIKLPIINDFNLPKKTVSISVIKYINNNAVLLNNIYLGKTEIAKDFFNIGGKALPFEIKKRLERINSIYDTICYIKSNSGIRIVYAIVNENDIVVNSLEEMKDVILNLSYEYENVNNILVLKK